MEKLTEPINAFKVSKSVKEEIQKIANEEELLVHHVVRMLIRIGLKNYHIVDSNKMIEISDLEINDVADRLGISTIPMTYFIEGAKWYREQLKQRQ